MTQIHGPAAAEHAKECAFCGISVIVALGQPYSFVVLPQGWARSCVPCAEAYHALSSLR